MQYKKLVWLFNNLDKYDYCNEGIGIKEEFSHLLVTEDTLENETIRNKATKCYNSFVENFYNDILGYQNGLANKAITAETLNCYFVNTSDGFIPIGLYKEQRPAETVAMMQIYLEQCKSNIKQDRNKIIAEWQSEIVNIADKYTSSKNQKGASLLKALVGLICSVPLLFYSFINIIYSFMVFATGNTEAVLKNYALLETAGSRGLIFLICFCFLLVLVAVIAVINSVREILLLNEKKNTETLLSNIHSFVRTIEEGTAVFIESSVEQCFDAARKGKNTTVKKNNNAELINTVNKRIKKATNYVNKADKSRRAIGFKTFFAIGICYICIMLLTFVHVPNFDLFADGNADTTTAETVLEQTNSEQDKDITEDERSFQTEQEFNVYTADDFISYVNIDYPTESVNRAPLYNTYYDNEFGFRIDYPSHFSVKETYDEITRRIYQSDDGAAILKINAGTNAGNITSRQLSDKLIEIYGGDANYNPVKDSWFALSTNDGLDYHYAYYKLENDIIRGFEFHFKGAENLEKYSEYIDHIYASFKKD